MRAAPLLPLLLLGLAAQAPSLDAAAALREGNRRFHAGDLEGALEVYAAGYDGDDPLLAYNAGTVAHHLERLPEALLWYRRALAADVDHPWLRDNLELVREQLRDQLRESGAKRGAAVEAWSFWMDHRRELLWTGVLLAWAALPAVLLPRSPRTRRIALAAVALAASAPFAAGLLLTWKGPQAAVLLQDCGGPDRRLPAGSEVQVFPAASPEGRAWRIPGSGLVCPEEAVGRVEP